mmetsp:Transcript_15120/g.38715  ORF Transcript_15120/g.38715 Transcript_15120/m.38715 type:complete len:315 (+) Transcript_15120:476-1420(+)
MLKRLTTKLLSPDFSSSDKLRLILLAYSAALERGLPSALAYVSFATEFSPTAAIDQAALDYRIAIGSLAGLQHMIESSTNIATRRSATSWSQWRELRSQRRKARHLYTMRQQRNIEQDNMPYELSRYSPPMDDIVDDFIHGRLSEEEYPYVDSALPYFDDELTENETDLLVVFVLGGVCHSELRSCYEASCRSKNFEVLVGGTGVLTPKAFTEYLRLCAEGEATEKLLDESVPTLADWFEKVNAENSAAASQATSKLSRRLSGVAGIKAAGGEGSAHGASFAGKTKSSSVAEQGEVVSYQRKKSGLRKMMSKAK